MKELKKFAKRYYFKHILICFLIEFMLFYAPLPVLLANPNPTSGTLPVGPTTPYGGVGSFDYTSGRLDIQNVANRAVINWQKFDIGAGATTQFHQASSSAYVLNRVSASDGMATGIKGSLIANGGVIVINPHGIVMGPSALINAGKFIASGLGISDKDFRDFAAGTTSMLKFDADCTIGNVTNSGTINGTEAVYLVGKNVTNTGTISCPGGMVVMAAGEKVYLTQSGSNVVVETLGTGSNAGDNVVTSGGTINATDAGVLLAAGDIFSQAAITDARSFVAQANRNLTVSGALDVTGDVTLFADYDHALPGDFHSTAPINAGGNIEVRGNDILFDETVNAGGNLTIKGRDCYENPEYPWGNIHAMKTLDAGGNITISDTGEKHQQIWVSQGKCGGGYWLDYFTHEPGTIWLDDDVTAGGNLSIYNNTYTGAGVTLRAGNNIVLALSNSATNPPSFCSWLTGDTWLALRAGNEIQAPRTVISVTGSTLIMEQGLSLNLDNYLFANQANTNLTLISNHGSVKAVETGAKPQFAADQWKSIGATADNGSDNGGNAILLSGNQKDIVATELRAYHDDITVNSKAAKVLATENVTADTGNITLIANTDIEASKNLTAGSDITATAGNNILLKGNATAGQNITLSAVADVEAQGNLTAGEDLIASAGNNVLLKGNANAGQDILLISGTDTEAQGDLTAGRNIIAPAGNNLLLKGNATAGQDIVLASGKDTEAQGNITAGGNITSTAGNNISLKGNATAGRNIYLTAAADVEAQGNLSAGQDVRISSSDNTTYVGGDIYAGHDILLNNNTQVNGYGDQTLEAGNKLTANGFVRKVTSGDMYLIGNSEDLSIDLKYNGEGPGTSTSQGNLWILGQGDIQISDDVTTFGPSEYTSIQSEIAFVRSTGGVAIISENGSIYTDGADGALNVSVTGSSDHFNKTGVYGFGPYAGAGEIVPTILAEADNTEARAAIAIVSADELKIGENGRLTAYGTYYTGVDDRAAIGFLDTEAEIPDGTPRNPGVPFDLAIYTASKNSSVTVNAPVTIESEPIIVPTILSEKVFVPQLDNVAQGAMVIDAFDTVTLGDKFMQSLANGDIGNRLEVCSRITEWLEDAVGRLPFLGSSDLPKGYSYVMRGAGLENPEITDGRAWVLERQNPEIVTAAAPIQQPELKFTGCPAVMNWVAKELGVEKDQVQIYVAGAMAMSSSVQPCDACARLKNTALVLMDADGAQVKALGEVVKEFTAAGAPPSEEQMAMIAASLKNPEEGTRYALAAQWLNALAEYINILHSDLNLPTDETMAFAAKYTSPVTGGDNAALAAYVQAKMDALGG